MGAGKGRSARPLGEQQAEEWARSKGEKEVREGGKQGLSRQREDKRVSRGRESLEVPVLC